MSENKNHIGTHAKPAGNAGRAVTAFIRKAAFRLKDPLDGTISLLGYDGKGFTQGSGFLIAPNILVTARHVVEHTAPQSLHLSRLGLARALDIYKDPQSDVAVILIEQDPATDPRRLPVLKIASQIPTRPLTVFNSASIIKNITLSGLSDIRIIREKGILEGHGIIQGGVYNNAEGYYISGMDRACKGFSGSPVLNAEGLVIGLHSGGGYSDNLEKEVVIAMTNTAILAALRAAMKQFAAGTKGFRPLEPRLYSL